jgi:succinate dehydrogenase flavin-adding protein (antitoxin of CptAB toxin-antitoxin module)
MARVEFRPRRDVRDTSLDAYFGEVLEKLGECQSRVLDVFYENPDRDFTNMELAQYLGWSVNRVTPRVYELREMGLLTLSRVRPCRVTGRRAMAWRVR